MVHKAAGDFEPPSHAARVRLHLPAGRVLKAYEVEQLRGPVLGDAPGNPVEVGAEHDVLPPSQVLVRSVLLRDYADRRPYIVGMTGDVVTADRCRAGGRSQKRGEHLDRR